MPERRAGDGGRRGQKQLQGAARQKAEERAARTATAAGGAAPAGGEGGGALEQAPQQQAIGRKSKHRDHGPVIPVAADVEFEVQVCTDYLRIPAVNP